MIVAAALLPTLAGCLAAGAPPGGECVRHPYCSVSSDEARPASAKAPPAVTLGCPPGCPPLTWVTKAQVTGGVEGAAAGVIGDKIYVSHGYSVLLSGQDTAYLRIYDLATDTWSLGPSAAVARSEGVGAVSGGKLYSLGGRALPANEVYDPQANQWTTAAPLPSGRKGMAVGVIAGKIHVVGGSANATAGPHSGTPIASHDVYDPATNSWTSAAPLPIPLGDTYAAVAFGGKLYVFGGWNGAAVVATTYIYDPASDAWTSGKPMPTARSNALAGVLCSNLFVIGGLDITGVKYSVVEAYDPVTDSWCAAPPLPVAVGETATASTSTSNSIHAIGSGPGGASSPIHQALTTASSCFAASLSSLTLLKGVKDQSGGARFAWSSDLAASEYHLNSVTLKSDIGPTTSKLPPVGIATGQCTATSPGCTDPDAVGDATKLLFYQAFSACGATGSEEGPF